MCDYYRRGMRILICHLPLVSFVHYQGRVLVQVSLSQRLSQQHAVRHILDHRLRPGEILEPDGIPHLISQFKTHFLGHALGYTHSGHTTGLGAAHHAELGVSGLVQVLRQLSGLTCKAYIHKDIVTH